MNLNFPAKLRMEYISLVFTIFFFFQVADFGLAHASKDGSYCFEPVNTDVRGTPG